MPANLSTSVFGSRRRPLTRVSAAISSSIRPWLKYFSSRLRSSVSSSVETTSNGTMATDGKARVSATCNGRRPRDATADDQLLEELEVLEERCRMRVAMVGVLLQQSLQDLRPLFPVQHCGNGGALFWRIVAIVASFVRLRNGGVPVSTS